MDNIYYLLLYVQEKSADVLFLYISLEMIGWGIQVTLLCLNVFAPTQ